MAQLKREAGGEIVVHASGHRVFGKTAVRLVGTRTVGKSLVSVRYEIVHGR
ncbi:hypothetical protein [Amycolatopsis australiensis]|uniref:hypothetical protein n=1 Tax=Amycolatopsis australiensis TaxID=546364 RepID=UPI0015A609BE|nr:hypothetical protein [Amycolatopsis australiensis]